MKPKIFGNSRPASHFESLSIEIDNLDKERRNKREDRTISSFFTLECQSAREGKPNGRASCRLLADPHSPCGQATPTGLVSPVAVSSPKAVIRAGASSFFTHRKFG
ncbi:hypothetical protein [Scytonema sp. HK-05]|uniref:hypothetical protein n=1 Tax=Scytonema sp. HK-05 TaxID=1137095 RepID=UPI000A4228F2|nr:hypothetical protein [Scytonema sp. HK-05]